MPSAREKLKIKEPVVLSLTFNSTVTGVEM